MATAKSCLEIPGTNLNISWKVIFRGGLQSQGSHHAAGIYRSAHRAYPSPQRGLAHIPSNGCPTQPDSTRAQHGAPALLRASWYPLCGRQKIIKLCTGVIKYQVLPPPIYITWGAASPSPRRSPSIFFAETAATALSGLKSDPTPITETTTTSAPMTNVKAES